MKHLFLCLVVALPVFFVPWIMPGQAFAIDKCQTEMSRPEWNNDIQRLSILISSQNYTKARPLAQALSNRCDRSPVLNYMLGKISEGIQDDKNALYYYIKASEYTFEFAVAPEVAQKIWYARYEKEHGNDVSDGVREQDSDGDHLTMTELRERNEQLLKATEKANWNMLWTGTAIGAAGIIMTGIGAGLALNSEPSRFNRDNTSYKNNPSHVAGWTLLGSGLGIAIAGIGLAGYFGYQYTHATNSEGDHIISFSLSPTSAQISMKF